MLKICPEYRKYVMQFNNIAEIDKELDRLSRNLHYVRNGRYTLILCRKKVSLYNYKLMLPQFVLESYYNKVKQSRI